MNWRVRFPLLATGFLGSALIALYFLLPREPSYEGKSLSDWLADIDVGNLQSREAADQAIRAMGTDALPWLRKMLCAEDPLWKRLVKTVNARQSIVRIPFTPTSSSRYQAVLGYGALGRLAKTEVPSLIHIMEVESSPQVRACVALALGGIGREAAPAIPVLARAAKEGDETLRKNAASALANIQMWAPLEFHER